VKTNHRSLSFVAGFAGLAVVLMLSGCSANFGDLANTSTQTAVHIQGVVHGGQQPLNGAHVYMYAASTAAYGGNGIAPTSGATGNASVSLLTSATGNPADGNGNFYVTTDVNGSFNINGAFACTPNTQVYLYSTGGDPQLGGKGIAGTPNPAATMMVVLGNCASATPGAAFPNATFVSLNEVSTVAAAYALAGFATDPLHIGAPSAVTGHTLSGTGLANAFHTALNLVNQASGFPNPTLPLNSTATVPVTTINTLADILAACVNTTGPGSTGCATLFTNTSYGTPTIDTATAALNIAQHPAANVAALLTLATATSPFQGTVSSANDFSFGIVYSGGGLNTPEGIAIDSAGNAWVNSVSAVIEISNTGTLLSGTTGYPAGGSLLYPDGIAIDVAGNVWVANSARGPVIKLSSAGTVINQYTASSITVPEQISIDGAGNAWISDASGAVTELSSTGAVLSGTTGYTGGLGVLYGIAIDGAGNAWGDNGYNALTEFSNTGTFLHSYTGGGLNRNNETAIDGAGNAWATSFIGDDVTEISNSGTFLSGTTGYKGGGLNEPYGIAIDGAGNAWVVNTGEQSVTEFSSAGTILSGAIGYKGGILGSLFQPQPIAIDGSGNAWVGNAGGISSTVLEMIGIGTPVITPIAAGLPAIPTTDGTSNLGTRP